MENKDKNRAIICFIVERIFLCLALLSLAQGWWPEVTRTFAFFALTAGTLGLKYCDR